MTDQTPSAFATWLSRHPCTREELWKIQNMLGDCMPDSELHELALEAWLKSSKHTFPDPHWDEGCIKCGGFDGEPCEPPETRLFTASDKKPEVPLSHALEIVRDLRVLERWATKGDWFMNENSPKRYLIGSIATGKALADMRCKNGVNDGRLIAAMRNTLPILATTIEQLHADHLRLIEAVEKKEGVKAFADLYFPPAA